MIKKTTQDALTTHFEGLHPEQLSSTAREFPGHMRVDVQRALDRLFSKDGVRFFGLRDKHRFETLTFASISGDAEEPVSLAPAQYEDIDVGGDLPAKCLANGLWLGQEGKVRWAAVLAPHREYNQESATRIEIAVPAGAAGQVIANQFFKEVAAEVRAASAYRGKILSLESSADYQGQSKGVTVHRIAHVDRREVILPADTLKLLDRNIIEFVKSRPALRELGQSTRKGVLLYGPPGTGKTHTIRYLATNLPNHTTILITAAQMGLLSQYMALARLLQPAMVVIEDVDLIARERENSGSAGQEALLNTLLNEMDGLKDNVDILFVLTTNRPEQLEGALAGRPGRIDQAIEIPLPDADGRARLMRLYGGKLALPDALVNDAVQKTEGVSATFIKELTRRAAQSSVMRKGGGAVTSDDFVEALHDMTITGGQLNIRLLGGATSMSRPAAPDRAGRPASESGCGPFCT